MPGLSLRVKTCYGRGAVANDFTSVYASYERGGRRARQLILDGAYLANVGRRWADTSVHVYSNLQEGRAAGGRE